MEGEEEIYRLPIAVSAADEEWFYERPFSGEDHITGRISCAPVLARERHKYVIMARAAEGVIFDEDGVCSESGYLYMLRSDTAPPGLRCDPKRRLMERQALQLAPRLNGAYAVFTPGTLANYTHWLIEGLLALHIIQPYLPQATRLLLPATLRDYGASYRGIRNHHETLAALGFGELPAIEVSAPYCWVEEVIWLDHAHIPNLPAAHVREFRARALAGRAPPARADLRIYLDRRGGRRIANPVGLEGFLAEHGFVTWHAEDLSFDEQIDLFRQAAWVIAPHGAGLGNLLFCPPGTRVIDIMPDIHFQPYFSYLANKLGLAYGVLPCPTTDGDVNGDIILNMGRLLALFRVMKNRL
jgi:capsular polysaccharide biosynthesis protein